MTIKRAVVTGGSGFLGINLIHQLVAQDWEVTALHRAGSDLSELSQLNINYLEADLTDKEGLTESFPEHIDALFHVAGDTNLWTLNNTRQYQTNVVATDVLSEVAISKKVKRFIHTSSISAYGFHDSIINEDTRSTAMSCGVNYHKTKYLGEQVIKNKVAQGRLDAVILNPCAIMGPFDKHNWAQLFLMIDQESLPGIPSGEGSYCHVKSVAAALISAYKNGRSGENYILAGVDHSFLEVVTKIGTRLNKSTPKKCVPPIVLYAVAKASYLTSLVTRKEPNMTPEKAKMVTKRVVGDCTKAVKELGYDNTISLDQMLDDCHSWLKSRGLV